MPRLVRLAAALLASSRLAIAEAPPDGSGGATEPESAWPGENVEVTSTPCEYVPGGTLDDAEETTCGSRCFTLHRFTLGPLELQGEDFQAECAPGKATLTSGDDRLELLWDQEAGQFRVAPEVDRRLARLAKAKPGGSGGLELARALATSLAWLPEPVSGARLHEALLLHGREAIARDRTVEAGEALTRVRLERAPPPVRERVAALRTALAEAVRASAPLRVAEVRRIGTVLDARELPPLAEPTAFWRGGALCVVQDDDRTRMRCYDPDATRWGALEAAARPPGVVTAGDPYRCGDHSYSLDGAETGSCGEWDALPVAVVPGPVVVLEGARTGLAAWRGGSARALSAAEASALAREGAGSRLVAGGTLLLAGTSYQPVGDPGRRWELIERLPDGEAPSSAALASPDQRWVLVESAVPGKSSSSSARTLWLARIEPASPGPARPR